MKRNHLLRWIVAGFAVVVWCGTSRAAAAPPEVAAADQPAAQPAEKKTRTLGIVLYPRFELLDVFGPAEVFGNLGPRLKVVMVAHEAGLVTSAGTQGCGRLRL